MTTKELYKQAHSLIREIDYIEQRSEDFPFVDFTSELFRAIDAFNRNPMRKLVLSERNS